MQMYSREDLMNQKFGDEDADDDDDDDEGGFPSKLVHTSYVARTLQKCQRVRVGFSKSSVFLENPTRVQH